MISFFSILFPITVSLVIALIFKQIDKSTSPGEKFRRFAEKKEADVNATIMQYQEALKNTAIDLQTQQGQAQAAIKRLAQQYSEFTERSQETENRFAEIVEMKKKLDAYSAEFSVLMDMTANVEENLERLKKETGVIDTLNKRLDSRQQENDKLVQAALSELEKQAAARLEAIRTEFDEKCREAEAHSLDRIISIQSELTAAEAEVSELTAKISAEKEANDKNIDSLEAQVKSYTTDIKERLLSLYEENLSDAKQSAETRAEEYRMQSLGELQTLQAHIQSELAAAQSEVADLTVKIKAEREANDQNINSLEAQIKSYSADISNTMAELYEEKLADVKQAAESRAAEYRAQSEADANLFVQELKQKQNEIRSLSLDELQTLQTKFFDELQTLHTNLETRQENIRQFAAELEAVADGNSSQLQDFEQTLQKHTDSALREAAKIEKEVSAKIESLRKSVESQTQAIENQFEGYKTDLDYRMKRIETSDIDVERFETNLRDAMSQAESRVMADFTTFSNQQTDEQAEIKATFRKTAEEIADELASLEHELETLKQTAVANTTNRLSDFEKTYYADLAKRGDELADQLTQWKHDFDSQLVTLGSDSEEKRRRMAAEYGEELKAGIAALQEKTKEQLAYYEDAAQQSDASLQERIAGFEQAIRESLEQSQAKMSAIVASSDTLLKSELDRHSMSFNEQLSRFEHEIEQKLGGITEEVGENQAKSKAAIDEVLSNFSTWKARINGQFDESKQLFNTQLETLDQNAAEMLDRVKEVFASDVAEYSGKVKQERSEIASEIAALKNEAASAITDYQARSEKVLSDAQAMYGDMVSDTERRVREQSADCEQQLRTMRTFAQETKEKNETAQNEMVLKLQAATTDLNKTFDDLEKRLKNVIAQSESSVFDKAEERQARLEAALSTMKIDLAQTEAFKPLIAELKQEYIKMQDMDREASGKLSKMSGEKKRIESLEADFNHLMVISAQIDEKKELFTSQHDDIQNFQTKLKDFNDELNAVEGRFDRLDKKNIDLDRTIADVDRSFIRLADLDKQLRECEQRTSLLPGQLAGVEQEASRVLENRDRINDAIRKLEGLEKTLGTAESKIEEVTKSRDIMSRTEMRLKELVDEAANLIKLFATVKTSDTKPPDIDKSALTANKRDQVRQLAQLGWKAEQIASRLKLTVTEVDLILEIPQKT
jgi:chromosome segregation ATPase